MIGHIHPLFSVLLAQRRWPFLCTRKSGIRRTEWRFPELRKFVEYVVHLRLISVVIHEDNDSLLLVDKLAKFRPVIDAHRDLRRTESQLFEARSFQWLGILGHFYKITVTDKEGNDVVGMRADPSGDVCEVSFCGASIEQVTRGVTVVYGAVYEVCLTLKHSNPIVQLGYDAIVLVCSCIVRIYEG